MVVPEHWSELLEPPMDAILAVSLLSSFSYSSCCMRDLRGSMLLRCEHTCGCLRVGRAIFLCQKARGVVDVALVGSLNRSKIEHKVGSETVEIG